MVVFNVNVFVMYMLVDCVVGGIYVEDCKGLFMFFCFVIIVVGVLYVYFGVVYNSDDIGIVVVLVKWCVK